VAVLSESERALVAKVANRCRLAILGATFSKADLRAAVDATDAWIDANASSYNTALPAAYRTSATLAQKTILLAAVALKRAGVSLAMLGSED
jgi:hypothetical protein